MREAKNAGAKRMFAGMVVLWGAIAMSMTLPAYGQQDVDPTWYNPWPSPPAVAAQNAQTGKMHAGREKSKVVNAPRRVAKASGKRVASRQKPS